MIVVTVALAIALVAVVWLFLAEQRSTQAQTNAERSELLNRIQRPEHITPAADFPSWQFPEDQEPDELSLVGTIAEPKADE